MRIAEASSLIILVRRLPKRLHARPLWAVRNMSSRHNNRYELESKSNNVPEEVIVTEHIQSLCYIA